MSNITKPIVRREWEFIRDRISLILAQELATQAQLDYDDVLFDLPDVYTERFVAFNHTEMPAINVMVAQGEYTQETQQTQDGTWTFYVDGYCTAKDEDGQRGDQYASMRLQRLMGMCQAIVMDSRFKTLLFTPGAISNRTVKGIMFADPTKAMEATNAVMARMTIEVRVSDDVELIDAIVLADFATIAQLSDTPLGYLWGDTGFTPPPPACAAAIYENSDGTFSVEIASGGTYIADDIEVSINSISQGFFPVNVDFNIPFVCPDVTSQFNGVQTGVDTPAGQDISIAIINSTPSLIGTLTTNTANTKGITIDDCTVLFQAAAMANGPAAETQLAILIVDQDDNEVGVVEVDTKTIKKFRITFPTPLNTANLSVTGITASVRANDDGDIEAGRGAWFTCGYTNPFYGGTARFRGNTGGYTDGTGWFDVNDVATTYALAFPDDECIDWKYYDQVGGTIPMWYLLSQGTTTPSPALARGGKVGGKSANTACSETAASTQNGYTNWRPPNSMEFISIIDWMNNINDTQGLNYKPFEYDPTVGSPAASGFRMVTSSIKNTSNVSYWISDNGVMGHANPATAAYGYWMIRTAILADIGL